MKLFSEHYSRGLGDKWSREGVGKPGSNGDSVPEC